MVSAASFPLLRQDTSGRMVVYDLLSGTVLGVLALRDSSSASKTTTKSNAGNDGVDAGGAPSSERAISPGNAGIVWASGGNYIAAVLPREEDQEVKHVLRQKSSYFAPQPDV